MWEVSWGGTERREVKGTPNRPGEVGSFCHLPVQEECKSVMFRSRGRKSGRVWVQG